MSRLFNRKVVLIVDSLEITDLQISFKVVKDGTDKPNSAEATVRNLAESSRSAVSRKGAPFIIQAGYGNQITTLFTGRVRTCDTIRNDTNWDTTFTSGDGEEELRFAEVSNSWRPGVPVAAVLREVINSMVSRGLQAGNSAIALATIRDAYANGFTAHGKSRQVLREILDAYGFNFSIQDGAIQLLSKDQVAPGNSILVSAETGLIGSPSHGSASAGSVSESAKSLAKQEAKRREVKFESLLQPFVPGRAIRLESKSLTGNMKVKHVEHVADTHGPKFTSTVEAIPL